MSFRFYGRALSFKMYIVGLYTERDPAAAVCGCHNREGVDGKKTMDCEMYIENIKEKGNSLAKKQREKGLL